MITVICGENSSESRKYFVDIIQAFEKKNIEVRSIKANLFSTIHDQSENSSSLFHSEYIYVSENVNKLLSKRNNPEYFNQIERLSHQKNPQIFIWEEELSSRFLKYPKHILIKEFKISLSIFKLLESCYPGNIRQFLNQLHEVNKFNDEMFIFIMLIRHLRSLILANLDSLQSSLPVWQSQKLKSQSSKWEKTKLIDYYHSLYNIEYSLKSGTNPYNIINSLDIVSCYYL